MNSKEVVRASSAGPFCMARLTHWERTCEPIGDSSKRASILVLCPNKPMKDLPICSKCLDRPDASKYQTRMIHGLLTEEPPPTSHIYGSEWYWKQVEKFGEPSKLWIELAKEAQRKAEERAGERAWRVKERDTQREFESMDEMPPKKKEDANAKDAKAKATLLLNFPLITKIYQESSKNPQQVQTDTLKILKKRLESGEEVWETEDGMRFKVDERGEIGEFIS